VKCDLKAPRLTNRYHGVVGGGGLLGFIFNMRKKVVGKLKISFPITYPHAQVPLGTK